MICSHCGKDAASLYRRAAEGKTETVALCRDCYERLYGDRDEAEFFAALLGSVGGGTEKICPACGTALSDFRRTGLLGCAHCYEAFREDLLPVIRQTQGSVRHKGQAPDAGAQKNYSMMRELVREQERLKEELERAMRERNFSAADALKERLMEINRRLYHGEEP